VTDHLAIFQPGPLARILSGEKTIESRFSVDRRPPFDRVQPGDRIWLKRVSGPVVAVATSGTVRFFDRLTPERIASLFAEHPAIRADSDYRLAKSSARYATLIELCEVRRLPPFALRIRGRSGWRVLDGPLTPVQPLTGA
jgi:hypothetical protein